MSKRLQGVLIGVLVGALLTSGIVFAEEISKTINAVYMNVKLVVDGVQIEPKDANGSYVEPFIYNGTTYLPVRAVGEAFGKDVSWDGDTATVYIGGKVDKPAKDITLFDKPYIECKNANDFSFGKSGDSGKLNNYITASIRPYAYDDKKELQNQRYSAENYVVYPLNGLAKKVKGTFMPATGETATVQFSFYNESGKLLYQSPIMNSATTPIDFEFDVANCIKLKVECSATGTSLSRIDCTINNLVIVTTDY